MNQKDGSPVTNVVHSKCKDQKWGTVSSRTSRNFAAPTRVQGIQTDVDQTQIPTNQMLPTDWGREIRSHCLVRTCNQLEKFYYLLATNT